MRWVGPRGWDVEVISLNGRRMFRARQHNVLRGYCATIRELEAVLAAGRLSMADLVEVLPKRRT